MRFFLLVDTSNKAYFPLVFIKKIFSGKKFFFSGFTKTFITFLFWWISQYNIAWKIVETLIYNIQKTAYQKNLTLIFYEFLNIFKIVGQKQFAGGRSRTRHHRNQKSTRIQLRQLVLFLISLYFYYILDNF